MADNEGSPTIEMTMGAIVITAQTWNPSIFTETWLAHNRIVTPEAIDGLRFSSPEVSQFQVGEIHLLVIPPSMQITFEIREHGGDYELPRTIATRAVQLLPHTPYQALGLNFSYFLTEPKGRDFNSYVRSLLGSGNNQLLAEFASADARFGRYFSKNHGEARLKLDIRPVLAGPQKRDMLHFSFNFHYELSGIDQEARVAGILKAIAGWGALRSYARSLVAIGTAIGGH